MQTLSELLKDREGRREEERQASQTQRIGVEIDEDDDDDDDDNDNADDPKPRLGDLGKTQRSDFPPSQGDSDLEMRMSIMPPAGQPAGCRGAARRRPGVSEQRARGIQRRVLGNRPNRPAKVGKQKLP